MSSNRLILSWEEIALAAQKVVLKIKLDEFRPNLVIGVFRGGVIPAAIVQRALAVAGLEHLNDYKFATVFAASYNNRNQQRELKVECPRAVREMIAGSSNILVVDDIYDSGRTMKKIVEVIDPQVVSTVIRTATLVTKQPQGTNYFGHYVEDGAWVEFPWEL